MSKKSLLINEAINKNTVLICKHLFVMLMIYEHEYIF